MRGLNVSDWVLIAVVALVLVFSVAHEANADENYFYTNIFWAKTDGNHWIDSGKLSTGLRLGYAWNIHENFWIIPEYEHKSQLMAGQPFNELPESYTDSYSVLLEWRF